MFLREKLPPSKVAVAEAALREKLEALLEHALVAGLKTLLVASLTDAALSAAVQVDVEALCERYLLVRYVLELCLSLYHALYYALSVLHALYRGFQEVACSVHHVVRILQHGVETLRIAWLVVSHLLKALFHVGRAVCFLVHCLGYVVYLLLVFSH